MSGPLKLNGFEVPAPLQALMFRGDWPGKRTSPAWLDHFGNPSSGFIGFCSIDQLERENRSVRDPKLAILRGAPSEAAPPGDFDPTRGFLIGFTDVVDDAICVDLRPAQGPRIIYMHARTNGFATAFDRLGEFCAFYTAQHGE